MTDRNTSPGTVPLRNALSARARLAEGPSWDAEAGVLWWVDIHNHRVHRLDPGSSEDTVYEVGEPVGCAHPTADGRVVLGLRRDVSLLDPGTGELERLATVLPERPGLRINDGKCDARGRLWVGSLSKEEGGAALFRVDPDGSVREVVGGLTMSNGLGWSPDGGVFYLTDSGAKTIYAYDFDPDAGALSRRRVFADLSGGDPTPDGLTVDAEGCVWSAQFDGGCLVRFAPDGGELLRVRLPVPRPTSCAFGGSGGDDLYVTTASVGMSEDEVEDAVESGDLFVLRPGVSGPPSSRFGGQG
ncbi:MAG TPA: SMP-30/gluconolactonase/LRE family protein [Longimicrobiaceae bacterium]|nr:SMP-30/gluconolactonase/LRE family protein [Longimicrobiaceae bacterium]